MRIGSFEFPEPVPSFEKVHVIAALSPWIDAGGVGTLSLARLERFLEAKELGSLATPGSYFDFTRYRPTVYYENGERRMTIPNTTFRFAAGENGMDFILLRMLEPHTRAEEYIDSIAEVLDHFKVERFCRIGSMYDAVPHTRPLLVMGSLNGEPLQGIEGLEPPRQRPYEGPTSIMNLVSDRTSALGIDNLTLMVRLPHYVETEADYAGRSRMLGVLSSLYGFPPEIAASQRAERQYERIASEMNKNPQVRFLVQRLEADYDSRVSGRVASTEPEERYNPPPLAPSIEEFLEGLGNGQKDNEQ